MLVPPVFPLLAIANLLSFASPVQAAAETVSRPNILWLVAEDMSPNLGCYGDAYAKTPAIDRLAGEGVRFTRCYAASPMCAPARSTLITGMHNGPLGTSRMRSNHHIPLQFQAFTKYLRDFGYYCSNNVKTDYNLAHGVTDPDAPNYWRNVVGPGLMKDSPSFMKNAWDESSPQAHWRNRGEGQPFFSVFNFMTTHQSRTSVWPYRVFQEKVQSTLDADEIHDPDEAPLPPHYPDLGVSRQTVARYYPQIPRDQQTVSSAYNLTGEINRTIRDLRTARRLNETLQALWQDARPPVQLFHIETDPWCLENLAADTAQAGRVAAMLAELEGRMVNERDLGLLPEAELSDMEAEAAPWHVARKTKRYPLEDILETVRLQLKGAEALPQLRERMKSPHVAVRFWAAVSLAASGADVRKEMLAALRDSHGSVRAEAAWWLAKYGTEEESGDALKQLGRDLFAENPWIACHAARILQLFGPETAGAVKPQLEQALKERGQELNYGFRFALRSALGVPVFQ